MSKWADIIFGQAVIERNYKYMQKQDRTNEKLITGYVQCWEGYFGNVIGYRLEVTPFKM